MNYQTKHTPAPWNMPEGWDIPREVPPAGNLHGFIARSSWIQTPNGEILAEVKAYEAHGFVKADVYEANARLICAAPLLLSALIKVVESHDNLVERLSNMQDQGHAYMRIPATPAGYEEAKAAIAQALNIKSEQP